MRVDRESPSELYHEASKLHAGDATTARTVWAVNTSWQIREVVARPAAVPHGLERLALPRDVALPVATLWHALAGRRSTRRFDGGSVTLDEFSALLLHSAAVTEWATDEFGVRWGLRCAPSGGALYPVDTYCVTGRVDGVRTGVHAYLPAEHALELLEEGPCLPRVGEATYLEEPLAAAAACFVLTATFARATFKYGQRAYRFVLLEAGHIAQNLLLAAHGLGLGALPVGGFIDDRLNALVGADGCDRAAVYAIVVGRPAEP